MYNYINLLRRRFNIQSSEKDIQLLNTAVNFKVTTKTTTKSSTVVVLSGATTKEEKQKVINDSNGEYKWGDDDGFPDTIIKSSKSTHTSTTTTPMSKDYGPYDFSKHKYLKYSISNFNTGSKGTISIKVPSQMSTDKYDITSMLSQQNYFLSNYQLSNNMTNDSIVQITKNEEGYINIDKFDGQCSLTINCSSGSFTLNYLILTNNKPQG